MWKYSYPATLLLGAIAGCVITGRVGTPPAQPGVVPVTQLSSCGSGVIVGEELVLTCHHCTDQGGIAAAWLRATVIACDPAADLALLLVPGLKGPATRVAGVEDEDIGSAVRYGLPGGIGYKATRCRVDALGNLDETAYPGNSGGPLIKDGKVVGIVLTARTVATAKRIRAFLDKAGFSRLHTAK